MLSGPNKTASLESARLRPDKVLTEARQTTTRVQFWGLHGRPKIEVCSGRGLMKPNTAAVDGWGNYFVPVKPRRYQKLRLATVDFCVQSCRTYIGETEGGGWSTGGGSGHVVVPDISSWHFNVATSFFFTVLGFDLRDPTVLEILIVYLMTVKTSHFVWSLFFSGWQNGYRRRETGRSRIMAWEHRTPSF